MRIVFMGTPDYAVPSLNALKENGYEIAAVFTQPDRPRGRGNKVTVSPVKARAEQLGIPVFQPEKIRRDGVGDLKALSPDLCGTAAFGQILSQELLDIPRLGTVNVHASLLPEFRGSSPVAWCILEGRDRTGVTTMLTDRGIDTGAVLMRRECPILPEDTAGTLTDKLASLGAGLLIETLRGLENGTVTPEAQDESRMSYYPMLRKEMGQMVFALPSLRLHNAVRAFDPWPGCFFSAGGEKIKVWKTEVRPWDGNEAPGTVLLSDRKRGLWIKTGDGALEVTELQAPGGKRMRAADYLSGHSLREIDVPGGASDAQ